MDFRIADTFQNSLAKLTGDEQKAVKTTAFDLQLNPANPGMKFHRLDKSKDKNFWSVRVSRDIRAIIHKLESSMMLCFVGHHDDAYHWAERRKVEKHPKTGAAQIVEVRELVKEITIPVYVEAVQEAPPKPKLFADTPKEELLGYGVPEEWIADIRQADEDSILELADHLPPEASEALLEMAVGGKPVMPEPMAPDADPFDHPDAQRRFRVMSNKEELERALEFPWDKWTVFLHPAQRLLVEREYNGPARVAGSAGTGKTIVALHRAVYLARKNPEARVLLTTFSNALASALKTRLQRLAGNEPRIAERLEVQSIDSIAQRIATANWGKMELADGERIRDLISDASNEVTESRFTQKFLWEEWEQVVDAWQIESWEAYRDVQRLGRKTRLAETQRNILWGMFEKVRKKLAGEGLTTQAGLFVRLANHLSEAGNAPFEFSVVDEAQDLTVPQLRFLAALGGGRSNSLFFAGDLGQRIFQPPFSWLALGVDVRGRSNTLRINYRTSHQIRKQADQLLPPEFQDVDGNTEDRRGTVSVFNGPEPQFDAFDTAEEEIIAVGHWLKELDANGFHQSEIGVFVRSAAQVNRAKEAIQSASLKWSELDDAVNFEEAAINICTMHLAKGLEFRAVAVMACDDEVIPLQERIETVADTADLEDVYNTERHLLYVACTRARDRLFVTAVNPQSEFLDDMKQ
ncbi:MAG: DEAD/DEAH box helicase [Verrucomicrobia subdivision 3 bacterium]|nr:DEAD/DEAH box helicase [Limisphaerales bacterium]